MTTRRVSAAEFRKLAGVGPPQGGAPKPKANRYGMRNDPKSKAARTYRGVEYASKGEARFAEHLVELELSGAITAWGKSERFQLEVNGVRVGSYLPDFWFDQYVSGFRWRTWVEIKSGPTDTQASRLRRRLFRALYPDHVLQLVDSRTLQYIHDPTTTRTRPKA